MADESAATEFFQSVENTIRRAVSLDPERRGPQPRVLEDAAGHLSLATGAKRIRPRLIQFLGQQLGVRLKSLVELAAAAELIHTASLLHDDVVDEGRVRRGLATVNARWGNNVAVLAGDWMLSQAFHTLLRYPQALMVHAVELIGEMSRGAVVELELWGRTDLTVDAWRAVAEGKTGSLFGYCAQSVALVARRPEDGRPLGEFGRRLGISFQMADDLKDLLDESQGKDRFSDLRNKAPSFALIYAAQHAPDLRERMLRLWSSPEVSAADAAAVGEEVARHRVMARTVEAFEREVAGAFELLRPYLREVDDAAGLTEALLGRFAWRRRAA
ncbi:MAG TPA: polyprenyl synthetase family protein [Myxococcaceae bacterium]|nr:polyprenyl synthetase family protein [Myxococcaceae bacterium]